MKIIPYLPEHGLAIKLQVSQSHVEMTPEYANKLAEYDSFTGIQDGRVIAIGGIIPITKDRAYLYLLVSDGVPNQWIKLYRGANRLISMAKQDYVRLETLSHDDAAERWLKMIGFEYEGTMRKAGPGGIDVKMFSIVRE